ncbi:MAG TPA: putative zinc-binding protein [Acidobacteriota bacterium]|nr:putative zinc-binding protein [Acidobacteriota bacterium]
MPELPRKKVGLVSCSGEEMAEGTVTRLATLKVLEELRPDKTVTICLPLFLAGGEEERTFARFYPTITIDGCEKRCAAKGTERYSSKPAVSIVVTESCDAASCGLGSARHLNDAGRFAVTKVAGEIALKVDRLLEDAWKKPRRTSVDPFPIIQEGS